MNRHAEELFIKETLVHCRTELLEVYDYDEHSGLEQAPILSDIARCIKIVEKWVKEDKQ